MPKKQSKMPQLDPTLRTMRKIHKTLREEVEPLLKSIYESAKTVELECSHRDQKAVSEELQNFYREFDDLCDLVDGLVHVAASRNGTSKRR